MQEISNACEAWKSSHYKALLSYIWDLKCICSPIKCQELPKEVHVLVPWVREQKKILLWGYIWPIDVGVNIRQWQALYSHLMSQTAVSLTKNISFKTSLKHRMDFFESFYRHLYSTDPTKEVDRNYILCEIAWQILGGVPFSKQMHFPWNCFHIEKRTVSYKETNILADQHYQPTLAICRCIDVGMFNNR